MLFVKLLTLATARSASPSPLKSPTAMEPGNIPESLGTLTACLKVPSPLPNKTQTPPSAATSKSGWSSLLKSPTVTNQALVPNLKAGAKLGVGQPSANVGLLWNRLLSRTTTVATVGNDTVDFTGTVRDGQQTPFQLMLLLSSCKRVYESKQTT